MSCTSTQNYLQTLFETHKFPQQDDQKLIFQRIGNQVLNLIQMEICLFQKGVKNYNGKNQLIKRLSELSNKSCQEVCYLFGRLYRNTINQQFDRVRKQIIRKFAGESFLGLNNEESEKSFSIFSIQQGTLDSQEKDDNSSRILDESSLVDSLIFQSPKKECQNKQQTYDNVLVQFCKQIEPKKQKKDLNTQIREFMDTIDNASTQLNLLKTFRGKLDDLFIEQQNIKPFKCKMTFKIAEENGMKEVSQTIEKSCNTKQAKKNCAKILMETIFLQYPWYFDRYMVHKKEEKLRNLKQKNQLV